MNKMNQTTVFFFYLDSGMMGKRGGVVNGFVWYKQNILKIDESRVKVMFYYKLDPSQDLEKCLNFPTKHRSKKC